MGLLCLLVGVPAVRISYDGKLDNILAYLVNGF